MADDLYTEDRDQSDSISSGSGIVEDSAGYSGAFFPSAQHFVVAGGTFTSNVINPPPTVPDGKRKIFQGFRWETWIYDMKFSWRSGLWFVASMEGLPYGGFTPRALKAGNQI
ncbi:hypothetical protein B0H13DRAFT_2369726 [Mycena leptocephala]|nr:hypothetical protein B0H13DRAFT_2369726 [Mycena leptocephala]